MGASQVAGVSMWRLANCAATFHAAPIGLGRETGAAATFHDLRLPLGLQTEVVRAAAGTPVAVNAQPSIGRAALSADVFGAVSLQRDSAAPLELVVCVPAPVVQDNCHPLVLPI